MTNSRWRAGLLAFGFASSGAAALSIHVAMLAAGAPFPISNPPVWAQWLSETCVAAAILVTLRLANDRFRKLGSIGRLAIAFAMIAAIRETLPIAIMSGVMTKAWLYSAFGVLPPALHVLSISTACVLCASHTRRPRSLIGAALAIGALGLIFKRILGLVLEPVIARTATLAPADVYSFPYPPHVNVAAYLTFWEAAAGAALLTVVVWDQLPSRTWLRFSIVALLVASVKGVAGNIVLYSAYTGPNILFGVVAWSQFLFEFLALGVLVAMIWNRFRNGQMNEASPAA